MNSKNKELEGILEGGIFYILDKAEENGYIIYCCRFVDLLINHGRKMRLKGPV